MQAGSCADVEFYASSDVDADADASSDRLAHSCTDVDVRAFACAISCTLMCSEARCGLVGRHAQACAMPHTHHGTHAPRTRTQA